jgi:hypothetical protein
MIKGMCRIRGFRDLGWLGASLLSLGIYLAGVSNALSNTNVHVTRHWHLHQPIYWPEWNANGSQTNRYQFGWDSLQLKINNLNRYPGSAVRHPQNNLVQGDPEGQYDAVFSPDDRVAAYQGRPKSSLSKLLENPALPFAGYSMSYSGSLIENVNSFGRNNAYGYSPNWNQNFIDIRNWRNQSGQRRHDLVGFTYHHSFGPLIPKSVLRKELEIFKEIYWKTWAGQQDKSDHSKGFWPSEAAFSRHMVDVLVDLGYEWSIVANSHLSRTAANFNEVAGLGNTTSNIDPPNRADQIGPVIPANQWWSGSQDGRGAWQAAPYAYQAHKVKYVNPETGQEKKLTIVPMDDVISYNLGYGSTGTGSIDAEISPFAADPARPVIVLVATDGENAWGGGYDSWEIATPGFLREAHTKGYEATAIQKFLDDHPVPDSATVHIEDGAWFNAANDWGHPQFVNWLYPPVSTDSTKISNPYTRYDFEGPGFAEDFRNWAVLMAGANWMETAEQIYKGINGPTSVQAWRIQEPYQANGTYNNPNVVERGWHIFLGGFDSGFMYYGDSLDDEVKQSLACNRAIAQVKSFVEANLTNDLVGPSVFKPQRFPWNPGGKGWGPITTYKPVGFNGAAPWSSEFYVWTHVYDLNDVQSVRLMVRVDGDGVNPVASNQNETFAGGGEVGTWIEIPMTKRVLPRHNPTGNANLNFFITPDYMADYYFAKVTDAQVSVGIRNKLLDYYVEARDSRNNVSKSDIQHVYVEDDAGQGGGGGGGTTPSGPVTANPNPPVVGLPVTITYTGTLASGASVNIHHGFNGANWTAVPGVAMTKHGEVWKYTYTVPSTATNIAMVFNFNGQNPWDNNGGNNYNFSTTNAPPTNPPSIPSGLTAQGVATNAVSLSWSASVAASGYTVYRDGNLIASVTGTSLLDTGCQPDTTYSYTVTADNVAGSSAPSLPASATTYFTALSNYSLRVVNPGFAVNTTSPAYVYQGQAGLGLTNGIQWSNALNGQTGFIPFTGLTNSSGWAWSNMISLGQGSNRLKFSASYQPLAVVSRDSATNSSYAGGWTNGSSGGSGFGPWNLSNTANAGFFIAGSAATNMNVNSSTGFGLYADSGGVAQAKRNLPVAMKTGDLFSLRFDNNWVSTGSQVGMALANSSGSNRFSFYFVGGQTNYWINDARNGTITGVPYSSSGWLLNFELTGSNSYRFTAGTNQITGNLGGDGAITQLVVTNNNAGSDTPYNLYLGDMTYVEIQPTMVTQLEAPLVFYNPMTQGIPDSWWSQYFGTTSGVSASADPDGDGFTNLQEYALGTNPMDSSSTFNVKTIERNGNSLTITWSSVSEKKYQVQAATQLNPSSWQGVGEVLTANSGLSTKTVTVPADASAYFVRVNLVP